MNYVLPPPSLQRMVGVTISIQLWSDAGVQEEIRGLLSFYKFPGINQDLEKRQCWRIVEGMVREKASSLTLAEPLKKYVLSFVRPIGTEIRKWWEYHENIGSVSRLPQRLCWTSQGTVDRKRTAELLIKDELEADVERRYRLACMYCLEEEIRDLWRLLPEQVRFKYLKRNDRSHLVSFWTSTINDEPRFVRRRDHSANLYACQSAVFSGNRAASEYFFEKLSQDEKEDILGTETVKFNEDRENCVDVVCFLLSRMSEEQRARLFEIGVLDVMTCFLVWPWQPLFLELIKSSFCWRFVSQPRVYRMLLRTIVTHIRRGECGGYDYKELFQEFWLQTPAHLKKLALADKAGSVSLEAEQEFVNGILNESPTPDAHCFPQKTLFFF